MLFKWTFKYFSLGKKVEKLQEDGVVLGTRLRNGRKVYLYMIKDFFVEVIYKNDNLDLSPERLKTFSNLNNLNSYLESDFKKTF
jgi:hypothetical protein